MGPSDEKLLWFMEDKHLSVLNKNPHNIMSIHISEKDDLLHSGAYGIISRYLIQGSRLLYVGGGLCQEYYLRSRNEPGWRSNGQSGHIIGALCPSQHDLAPLTVSHLFNSTVVK